MRQFILIADSGGTKTDWVLLNGDEKIMFQGKSCHPHFWSADFWLHLAEFLHAYVNPLNCRLFFFGSGCLRAPNNEIASEEFEKMGFETRVFSDLHAVGFALYGNNAGWCAISGTGSVLFEWSGTDVIQIIGGKGHEIGDEGSGFYFGKLVFEAFQNNRLSSDQLEVIESRKIDLLFNTSNPLENKKELSQLPMLLADKKMLFEDFHLESVRRFVRTHLDTEVDLKIRLSGSYVFYHQEFWYEIVNESDHSITTIIEKPIDLLIEQKTYFID